jgi:hypothetical protein
MMLNLPCVRAQTQSSQAVFGQPIKSMHGCRSLFAKHLHNNAIHLTRRLQVAGASIFSLRAGDRERSEET